MKKKLILLVTLLIFMSGCSNTSESFSTQINECNEVDDSLESNSMDISSVEESNEDFFVPDCSEDEYRISGNTQSNIKNGGFVTWQGDWVYYFLPSESSSEKSFNIDLIDGEDLYKENYESGFKEIIFSGEGLTNLCVYKDNIFFLYYGKLCSVRCDGANYTEYLLSSSYIDKFYIYDGKVYYISSSNLSASSKVYYLTEYDIETQKSSDLVVINNIDYFFGIEDGYAYWMEYDSSAYYVYEYILSCHSLNDYVCCFSGDDEINSPVGNGSRHVYDNVNINQRILYSPRSCIDFENQYYIVKNVQGLFASTLYYAYSYNKNNTNFFNGYLVHNASDNKFVLSDKEDFYQKDSYTTYINSDKIYRLFSDETYLYYDSKNCICRVRPDGTCFEFLAQ